MQNDRRWRSWAAFASLGVILPALILATTGCGNGSSSGTTGSTHPAPFDRAKDEGKLIGDEVVTTYDTGATGSMTDAAAPPRLNTFYAQLVCNGLDQQDCATNVADLDTPMFGNFDLSTDPIGNNPLGIKTIDGIKIDYEAINVDGTALTVSGGIDVPEVGSGSLKGVILYFHGTTVQRTNVPSTFTPTTQLSPYTDSILMAAIWASQGYVVVMPDYIGLGDDTTDVHPYVTYPRENAQSGLAMLKAARAYLKSSHRLTGRVPLFITGYSEGGAYALEAARLMQENPRYASVLGVKLREAAPMSGFFDLSGTGLPYLFDNISTTNNQWASLDPTLSALSKPYLSAYLALSFAHYSGIAPTDVMATDFYNCPNDTNNDCGTNHNLDGLYFTATQIPQYDLKVQFLTISLAELAGWSTAINAVTPLLTESYADALLQRDTSNPLYRQLVSADTYLFVPDFPVVLVSLAKDSVVTRRNTDVAYAYFLQENPNGPYQEILIDNNAFLTMGSPAGKPIDHTSELPFLTVLVLNEFNTASQ